MDQGLGALPAKLPMVPRVQKDSGREGPGREGAKPKDPRARGGGTSITWWTNENRIKGTDKRWMIRTHLDLEEDEEMRPSPTVTVLPAGITQTKAQI